MLMSAALKDKVWVASRSVTDGVARFGTPVEHQMNYSTTTSNADIIAFGPSYVDYRRIFVPKSKATDVKELDRVWLGIEPSDPTDPLASDANFYVQSKIEGHHITQLLCKRVTHE